MLGKTIALGSILAIICLAFVLQTTAPATVGPLGILLVFILMYVAALGVLVFLILGVQRVILKIVVAIDPRKAFTLMSSTRAYYFASVIALAPVMIIGMQSVGQVGIYELSLVIIFLIIACVYIAKRTR